MGKNGKAVRLLMIDNYDSFTYNLVQYLGELGAEVTVKRNDAIDVAGIRALHPSAVVISPGPCTPTEAGISLTCCARWRAKFQFSAYALAFNVSAGRSAARSCARVAWFPATARP